MKNLYKCQEFHTIEEIKKVCIRFEENGGKYKVKLIPHCVFLDLDEGRRYGKEKEYSSAQEMIDDFNENFDVIR